MSFWDNMRKFTSSYSDDEYDEEEDFGEEPYEEEAPAPRAGRRSADTKAPETSAPAGSGKSEPGSFSGKVLPMSNKPSMVLFRPTSFNDASQAADDLRNKKAVIVNMENVDRNVARRVVDFLSGCAYALDGKVKKIAQSTYLFCPNSMDVSGDLEAIQTEAEANA